MWPSSAVTLTIPVTASIESSWITPRNHRGGRSAGICFIDLSSRIMRSSRSSSANRPGRRPAPPPLPRSHHLKPPELCLIASAQAAARRPVVIARYSPPPPSAGHKEASRPRPAYRGSWGTVGQSCPFPAGRGKHSRSPSLLPPGAGSSGAAHEPGGTPRQDPRSGRPSAPCSWLHLPCLAWMASAASSPARFLHLRQRFALARAPKDLQGPPGSTYGIKSTVFLSPDRCTDEFSIAFTKVRPQRITCWPNRQNSRPLAFALPLLDHEEVIAAPEGDNAAALICDEPDKDFVLRRELADLLKRQLAKRSIHVRFVLCVHPCTSLARDGRDTESPQQ